MNKDEIILVKAFETNIDEMLIVAAYEDDTQEARRLIEAGADVNAREGCALIYATSNNNIELTRMLIEAGADVNAQKGKAMENAINNNNVELVRMLVKAGDCYALNIAVESGNDKLAQRLIEAGAEVDARRNEVLKIAVMNDNIELARMLIEAGADVNTVWDRKTGVLLKRAIKENDAKEFYELAAYVKRMIERDRMVTASLLGKLDMYHNEIH